MQKGIQRIKKPVQRGSALEQVDAENQHRTGQPWFTYNICQKGGAADACIHFVFCAYINYMYALNTVLMAGVFH